MLSVSHLILFHLNVFRGTECISVKSPRISFIVLDKNPKAQEDGSDFPKTRATGEGDQTGNRSGAEARECRQVGESPSA